jgi:hypothetical protein
VRATRPRLVVETGVHDGLGSTVLLRALERNAREGHHGRLVSFDPAASSGWLIPAFLRSRHRLVTGLAPESFEEAIGGEVVGLFIHDSDHSYGHETAEFEAIRGFASPGTVYITDNAHGSTAFRDFCARHGLGFRIFRETPRKHWYPGAAMGIAVEAGARAP